MRRILKPFLAIVISFTFFSVTFSPLPIDSQNSCDWLMFGKSPDGNRITESGCGLSSTSLCKLWETRFQIDNFASPVVWNDNLYMSDKGSLYCINQEDRSVKWSYLTEQCENFSHAVDSGKVYVYNYHVPSRESRIVCLDATKGTLIWSYLITDDFINYPLAIYLNKVYASLGKGGLVCLDGLNGKLLWMNKYEFTLVPVFGNNRVYLPGIRCLDATTGKVVWDKDKDYLALSYVAIENTNLYSIVVDKYNINIVTLDAVNGKCIDTFLWTTTDKFQMVRNISFANGKLFVSTIKTSLDDSQNAIFCFDLESRKLLWSIDTGNHMLCFPTFDNGNIIVGSNLGLLMFIDMDTGKIVQTYNIGQPIGYELVVASGKLFVPTRKALLCYMDDF